MATKLRKVKAHLGNVVSASFAALTRTTATDTVQYALCVLPALSPAVPCDGRDPVFFDAQALADDFNSRGRKCVVDVGHLTEYCGDAPAIGFGVEAFVDASGALHLWCEMNADGVALIEGKKFGFTSPVLFGYQAEDGWYAKRIKSLAVTNNPALEMTANFSCEDDEDAGEPAAAAGAAEVTVAVTVEVVAPVADIPAADAPCADAAVGVDAAAASTPAPALETAALATPAATEAVVADATPAATTGTTDYAAGLTAAIADMRALSAAQSAAFAARDAALAEVATLTASLGATALQLTAVETAFAAYKAAQVDAEVVRTLEGFTAARKATPAEREVLLSYGRKEGTAALTALLNARPAILPAAFTAPSAGADQTEDPRIALQREWVASQGMKPEF